MVIALVFAIAMNGFVYWKSDTLALRANGARELGPGELPRLRAIVTDLAQRGPASRCRASTSSSGPSRTPSRPAATRSTAAVAVTTGILELMDERQLAGVLAHELSHVKNRDTLVGTIAATIGGAISFLAQMAQFQMIFGGRDDDRRWPRRDRRDHPRPDRGADHPARRVARPRIRADASGAALTGDPEGLAQALEKLEAANQRAACGLACRGAATDRAVGLRRPARR